MSNTFKEWVDQRLNAGEPEPFCPFLGPSTVGYCDRAYSDECYVCGEAKGEWEAVK